MFEALISTASFVPHGYCLLWQPGLVMLHAVSDFLIFAAYFSIPLAIAVFMRRRRDLEFRWVAHLFAAFILLCGTTHLISVGTLWFPYYGAQGLVKCVTAIVSLATAAALWWAMPKALALPSPQQLRAANEQLAVEVEQRIGAERELEARALDLERSNRDLEQFAFAASHDLREPLRAIAGYCDVLRRRYREQHNAEAERLLGYAIDGVVRMQALIADLLDYARVGASGPTFAPTDLHVAVATASVNLARTIADQDAQIEADALPSVLGDEALLVTLFQNLFDNAIKYRGEAPPRIRVTAEAQAEVWKVTVADNGIGLEPRFAERIFQIFKRLHGRDAYPGTGIGLAICNRIVERHGGRIWLEPGRGPGARFCFTLPSAALVEARARAV